MQNFEDLKVLDLSSVLAGPLCGSFFSELGARVIKVENVLSAGDVTRTWKLPGEDPHAPISSYYAAANYAKELVLLDFNDKAQLDKLKQLIRDADIVISNFRSSTEKRFGLDYASIKSLNAKVIFAKITGYSDHSEKPAYDVILQAEAGYISMTGSDEMHLAKLPVAFIDVLASHQLREGILLAMLQAQKQATSYKVEVSLLDCALSALVNQASAFFNAGVVAKPIGTRHPNIAPYGDVFETSDGSKILFAIGSELHWKKLCLVLNLEMLIKRYPSNQERVSKRQQVMSDLAPAIKIRSWDELRMACERMEIPVAKIRNIREALEDETAKALLLEDANGKRLATKCFQISS